MLKTDFKKYSTVGKTHTFEKIWKYTYPNCTMPWHQSMLGLQAYNQTDMIACSKTDAYTLWYLDYLFLKMGATMKNPNCMGKIYMLIKDGNVAVTSR